MNIKDSGKLTQFNQTKFETFLKSRTLYHTQPYYHIHVKIFLNPTRIWTLLWHGARAKDVSSGGPTCMIIVIYGKIKCLKNHLIAFCRWFAWVQSCIHTSTIIWQLFTHNGQHSQSDKYHIQSTLERVKFWKTIWPISHSHCLVYFHQHVANFAINCNMNRWC